MSGIDYRVREATIADIPALNKLTDQLGYRITESQTAENLRAILKQPAEMVLVVEAIGKVVAWIHIFHAIRLESGSFCELGGLVVDEEFRGRGIGERLIGEAKQWCRQREVRLLRLRSNVKRKDAHRFYFRLGFVENKEQKVLDLEVF